MIISKCIVIRILAIVILPRSCLAISITRRDCLSSTAATTTLLFTGNNNNNNALAATTGGGLAAKLSARDPALLKLTPFNIPPAAQIYPEFMHGTWDVTMSFRGYLFPSKTIPKDQITRNLDIPGFQKCSIAMIADVGNDVKYRLRFNNNNNNNNKLLEDRVYNIQQSIDAHLGYKATSSVIYDVKSNPNRVSINFEKNRTRNAERIELFCNARDSEEIVASSNNNNNNNNNNSDSRIFVCSEQIRQVTFSLSQEFGVARQVVGNYAHFWTWREQQQQTSSNTTTTDGRDTTTTTTMTGNVLTAAYLDPQDPLFFNEPQKPVAVYSHDLIANRISLLAD